MNSFGLYQEIAKMEKKSRQ